MVILEDAVVIFYISKRTIRRMIRCT